MRTRHAHVPVILLATFDVLQIIGLNCNFKIFDSTLAMLTYCEVYAAIELPGASHSPLNC